MLRVTTENNEASEITVAENGTLIRNGAPVTFDVFEGAGGILSILYNGRSFTAIVEKVDKLAKEVTLRVNGYSFTTKIAEPIDLLLANMGMGGMRTKGVGSIKAPMPGMVLKTLVEPGQAVEKGDGLLILEAMKMENLIKAPAAGVVKSLHVTERTAVEKGTVLVEME
jgi:biotin carboxyl carrier protein